MAKKKKVQVLSPKLQAMVDARKARLANPNPDIKRLPLHEQEALAIAQFLYRKTCAQPCAMYTEVERFVADGDIELQPLLDQFRDHPHKDAALANAILEYLLPNTIPPKYYPRLTVQQMEQIYNEYKPKHPVKKSDGWNIPTMSLMTMAGWIGGFSKRKG